MKHEKGRHAYRHNLDAMREREWKRDYDTGIDPVLPIWLQPETAETEAETTALLEGRATAPTFAA